MAKPGPAPAKAQKDLNGPVGTTSGGVRYTDSISNIRQLDPPTAGSMAKLPAVKSLPKVDPMLEAVRGVPGSGMD
jgi:hypothetical protein